MLKFYKYLYYRIYSWNSNKWGENDMPHWNALIGVSVIMCFNTLLILSIIDYFDLLPINSKNINDNYIILYFISISILNYVIFIHGRKYSNLKDMFSNETKYENKIKGFLLFVFVILSFVLPFYLGSKI